MFPQAILACLGSSGSNRTILNELGERDVVRHEVLGHDTVVQPTTRTSTWWTRVERDAD